MQISFTNQCNFLCTPACKTNIQEPPGKGGVKVLRLRDQLGVSGESYPVLPDHPLPSSRTSLFSSKPPLSSIARGCPQGQGAHLHQLHRQQQRVQHPTAVWGNSNSSVRKVQLQQQCEEGPTAVWGGFNSNSSVRRLQQQCEEGSTPTAVWGGFDSNSSVRKAQLQQRCKE